MAAVILMMMAATVIEKTRGSEVSSKWFYHNPLFIAFWAAAAVSGLVYIFSRRMQKSPFTLLMHLSFVLILAGALTTHIFGKTETIRLRLDEANNDLPFELVLTDFSIERYSGSMAASDYHSTVRLEDGSSMEISMNNIGKYRGYRFYQASYDSDLKGSVLSVSHDPAGIAITYSGYILLLLSMLGFFTQKNTAFRRTLRKVASASMVLLLLPQVMSAKELDYEMPPAVPKDVADEFGKLYVYYNDRVAPFETLARDYCMKAYGKASFNGYTAEQVVTGWLFYYDWWTVVPFKLKQKDIGTQVEYEKESIRMSAATGDAYKMYPIALSEELLASDPSLPAIMWFSCDDALPADIDMGLWTFVRRSLDLIHDEIKAENWDEVKRIVSKIALYQEKTAGSVLPSEKHLRAERLYNRISRPMIPFMASITLGLILFILAGFRISRGRKTPRLEKNLLEAVTMVLFIYLTVVLVLRWYVSGHAPFAGSYSVMMLMAWLTTIAMSLLYRRFSLVQPLGFILAGFTMLMASLASANPQITHLMPVLQSPLLSLHVLSMMISYTLFGIVALNGIMGISLRSGEAKEKLMDVSLIVLYPAVFLLTFGTFLGAVWANVSWGSYWTWDPKETWALITILVYSAALHGKSLPAFRRPNLFHIFCILAFVTVLVTYFGVNLILGGMHAYA